MKVALVLLLPLLLSAEVVVMMNVASVLSSASTGLFLLGILLTLSIIYLNLLLTKFIIKQFKN